MNVEKEKILLIGGGGHCHSVIDVIEQQAVYQIAGIVDVEQNIGKSVLGYTVIGADKDLPELAKKIPNAIVTIGHIRSNDLRLKVWSLIKNTGFKTPSVISPLAYVSKHASIGEGTIVMHHAVVNANARVGENCIINTKALIEHDVEIQNHCHISTASVVNGAAKVMANTFVGSNATVIQGKVVSGFVKAGALEK